MTRTLNRLAETIAARADAATSYTAQILSGGAPLAARKLGEEAVETIVAALSGDAKALAAEAADLLFHLLVLLHSKGVAFAEVEAELERREGVSGIDEKAARSDHSNR